MGEHERAPAGADSRPHSGCNGRWLMATATLRILKGPNQGQRLPLTKPEILIGREARDCDVVIPNPAVSRFHAQISLVQGQFFIEDLKSRNGTAVNNIPIQGRTLLRNEDRVKICETLFVFESQQPAPSDSKPPLPPILQKTIQFDDDDDEPAAEAPSTVQATLAHRGPGQLLESQPAERLKALIEISEALGRSLALDELFPKIGDVLIRTFRQADRCFVILLGDNGELMEKVKLNRRANAADDTTRFSKSIVKQALLQKSAILCEDATSDNRFNMAQSISDFRIRSVMCAPLVTADDRALGVIQLDTQDRAKRFTQDDLKLLASVCSQSTVALEIARLHEQQLAQERVRRDLELAEQVQRGFLPARLPEVAGFQFFAQYKSAMTIGGDYYDFIQLPGGRWAILLGDVAGKGVPAALLMAKLGAEARFCMLTQPDPAAAIAALNDELINAGLSDRFVTMTAVVFDPNEPTLRVVNAGHWSPLIYRGATGELVDAINHDLTGPPLGIVPGMTYDTGTTDLDVGDTVIIFTDGVIDAVNSHGTQFTFEGVRKALIAEDSVLDMMCPPPTLLGKRLFDSVKSHSAGCAQFDDIAIVVFGRYDQGRSGNLGGLTRDNLPRVFAPHGTDPDINTGPTQ